MPIPTGRVECHQQPHYFKSIVTSKAIGKVKIRRHKWKYGNLCLGIKQLTPSVTRWWQAGKICEENTFSLCICLRRLQSFITCMHLTRVICVKFNLKTDNGTVLGTVFRNQNKTFETSTLKEKQQQWQNYHLWTQEPVRPGSLVNISQVYVPPERLTTWGTELNWQQRLNGLTSRFSYSSSNW